MAKTGTTALLPNLHEEFRALCLAGLKNEELAVKYGFSWVTARKYRILLAKETMRQKKGGPTSIETPGETTTIHEDKDCAAAGSKSTSGAKPGEPARQDS